MAAKRRQHLLLLRFQTVPWYYQGEKCKAQKVEGESAGVVLRVVVHEPVSWGMWIKTSIPHPGTVAASTETSTTTCGVVHL
jgi:hypothetical protein